MVDPWHCNDNYSDDCNHSIMPTVVVLMVLMMVADVVGGECLEQLY